MVEDGRAHAAQPFFEFLIVGRKACAAHAHQLHLQGRRLHDGARRVALQRQPRDQIIACVCRQERQHGLARRRAMDLGALPCARQRLQLPAAFDVRDRQHLGIAQDRHVCALAGLVRNRP